MVRRLHLLRSFETTGIVNYLGVFCLPLAPAIVIYVSLLPLFLFSCRHLLLLLLLSPLGYLLFIAIGNMLVHGFLLCR